MYMPTTGRFNKLDPFLGDFKNPQSLHKYGYVHGDPINTVDPTGEFGIALGLAIGFSFQSYSRATKADADLAKGAIAMATIRGFAKGYLIGVFVEMFLPVARTHFRVSSADQDYAEGLPVPPAPAGSFSANNRSVIDMAQSLKNKERIVRVLEVVRSTTLDRLRADTCNCWVYVAATRLSNLPREYWDSRVNGEFDIEQVEYAAPTGWEWGQEHALLRVLFKNGGVAYFDNGALGDTNPFFFAYPRLEGAVAFPQDIPATFTHKPAFDQPLDDIKGDPGRIAPYIWDMFLR